MFIQKRYYLDVDLKHDDIKYEKSEFTIEEYPSTRIIRIVIDEYIEFFNKYYDTLEVYLSIIKNPFSD